MAWEFAILDLISYCHTAWTDSIMITVSSLGNSGFIWIVIACIFLLFPKYQKIGITMLLALFIMLIVGNIGLKTLIKRSRPFQINPNIQLLIPPPGGYSFPSGHAFSSFAGAGVLAKSNRRIGILGFILAGFIAFSRLYLYVHFPTDVFAGIVLGLITSEFTWKIVNYLQKLKSH